MPCLENQDDRPDQHDHRDKDWGHWGQGVHRRHEDLQVREEGA